MSKVTVGEVERKIIKEALDKEHMSIRFLAQASSVGYSTLKNFFNGTTSELKREHIVLIANTLNLTYREFCNNEAFDEVQAIDYYEEIDRKKCEKCGACCYQFG